MGSFLEWYLEVPVVTRFYMTSSVLTTAACSLELLSPFSLYFNFHLVFMKLQLWRLLTNFFFFGSLGVDFLFHMFFLVRYCRLLEEGCAAPARRAPLHPRRAAPRAAAARGDVRARSGLAAAPRWDAAAWQRQWPWRRPGSRAHRKNPSSSSLRGHRRNPAWCFAHRESRRNCSTRGSTIHGTRRRTSGSAWGSRRTPRPWQCAERMLQRHLLAVNVVDVNAPSAPSSM